jgi:hypothetical protein
VALFGQAAAQQFQHARFIFHYEQLHRVWLYHSPGRGRRRISHLYLCRPT